MKIVHIFATRLFSFHYHDEQDNELDRLLNCWSDVEYVYNFLKQNSKDIQNITIEELTEQIISDANEIDDILYKLSTDEGQNLQTFFKQLNNQEYQLQTLSRQKGRRNYLRVYALKIDDNCFVITGGAIKLTLRMDEREHTIKELQKLEKCRQYFNENSVFDSDSFYEFLTQ